MANLTLDQKDAFLKTIIEPALIDASQFAGQNRGWDIAFKVVILLLGIAVVVFSAYGSTDAPQARISSIVGAICGGVVTVLSAFAFQQFDFKGRQNIWETKRLALIFLKGEMILDTDAETFRQRLDEVMSWNDGNPPKILSPPKPATAPLSDATPTNPAK